MDRRNIIKKRPRLTLKPDTADSRDYKMPLTACNVPKQYMIEMRKAGEQGELGSCTAWGLLGIVEHYYKILTGHHTELSKIFQYYNTRQDFGDVDADNGCSLRDTLKAYNRYGCCIEAFAPYEIAKFNQKPTTFAYVDGAKRNRVTYFKTTSRSEVQFSIACDNIVLAGIRIYDNFYDCNTNGFVKSPSGRLNGLHCVEICGYENTSGCAFIERILNFFKIPVKTKGHFICRNSWGDDWGVDGGFFKMPYDVFDALIVDAWSVHMTDEKIKGD